MKIHITLLPFLFLLLTGAALAEDMDQKAVLVTGASSGSGRVIAETLAERGYFVYAGARKQADLDELNQIDNIQAIRLDVTVQSDIDAAVETVEKEGRGLYGLVNNAGIAVMGPLVEIPESDLDFIFDVNVYGPYRVTKAFAPMIIESKGRITTTGSVAGFASRTFYGPYSMSKHAMEAFTDALADEMQKFDVKVSIIEPGGFSSKIGTSSFKRMQESGYDFDSSLYKDEWEQSWFVQTEGTIDIKNDVPERIAEAVIDTLESDNPDRRYMIVGERDASVNNVRTAFRRVVQVNGNQVHALDRDELVAMLDELLEE